MSRFEWKCTAQVRVVDGRMQQRWEREVSLGPSHDYMVGVYGYSPPKQDEWRDIGALEVKS